MRKALDAYYTPAWQTQELLSWHYISGYVFEPCSGDDSIANVLRKHPAVKGVTTNDIDTNLTTPNRRCLDARHPSTYTGHQDWIVTNPPYTMPDCLEIVQNAVKNSYVGAAILLRLSFLEPTDTRNPRGPWLALHPPTSLLVLPRHSYTQNGKSDSVTTAWFIWEHAQRHRAIRCAYGADIA